MRMCDAICDPKYGPQIRSYIEEEIMAYVPGMIENAQRDMTLVQHWNINRYRVRQYVFALEEQNTLDFPFGRLKEFRWSRCANCPTDAYSDQRCRTCHWQVCILKDVGTCWHMVDPQMECR